jgi:hypothetical protein
MTWARLRDDVLQRDLETEAKPRSWFHFRDGAAVADNFAVTSRGYEKRGRS